jgi:hypothetical protein
MTTANEAELATLLGRLATEWPAYAHRYSLPPLDNLTADGATVSGSLGRGHAARDVEAIMRRWGGKFTVTEEDDGTLTVAGTLTVTAVPDPTGLEVLFTEDWSGDLSAYRQFDTSPGGCAIVGDTLVVDSGAEGEGGGAYIDRAFPASTTGIVSLRCSLTFGEWAITGGGGFAFLSLMILTETVEAAVLGLAYTDGLGYYASIFKLDGSGDLSSDPITIPDGATVELIYDRSAAQPTGSLYVNGVLGATVTDPSTADPQYLIAVNGWGATSLSGYGGRAAFALGPVSVANGAQGIPG